MTYPMTRRDIFTAAGAAGLALSAGGSAVADTPAYVVPTPVLSHVTDIVARLLPPQEVGDGPTGARRIIPITGGEAKGPRLNGTILPGGADFQLIRHDNLTEIQARYIVDTAQGRVYVENTGIRRAAPDIMEKLKRGEPVDPAQVYFRSTPRFETASPDLAWMQRSIFVCSGARFPDHVLLSIFEVS